MIEGSLSFRVKTGIVECMGYVVEAGEQWVDLVSGDPQRRNNSALLLPITNISGKTKQATIELKERIN